jgi:acyl transferase domain-containing protein
MKPDSDTKPEQNAVASHEYSSHPEPIAIVGMECIFPGAANMGEYWKNIVNGESAVREVPPSRWNPADYDLKAVHGAFIDGLTELDPLSLGIMPAAVDEGDPEQFLVFSVIHNALRDAERGRMMCGDKRDELQLDACDSTTKPRRGELLFALESPERTEVVIGRGGGYLGNSAEAGYLRMEGIAQIIDLLRETSPHLSPDQITAIRDRLVEALPRQTAETVASVVPNITSGRVANRLNFMGANYIVDAACASSLIAVDHAVRSLRERRCDLGIAAGVNISQKPHFWYAFEKLSALSKSGNSRPYSDDADGLIIGEGIGAVVLKRLSDAQRDGDRIYAVIGGVGVSSDGRGTGVMTPRLEGQVLALQRAYTESGIDPQTISLIEGHGTGTPVGDATEIDTLHAVFGREG